MGQIYKSERKCSVFQLNDSVNGNAPTFVVDQLFNIEK